MCCNSCALGQGAAARPLAMPTRIHLTLLMPRTAQLTMPTPHALNLKPNLNPYTEARGAPRHQRRIVGRAAAHDGGHLARF